MFKILLNFLRKISKRKSIPEALEEGQDNREKKDNGFKNELKFNDGKEIEKLIQEILSGKEQVSNPKEINEKMIEYIDVLIKRIDKCQNDITILKSDLRKINN